jgi:hypothetical protein
MKRLPPVAQVLPNKHAGHPHATLQPVLRLRFIGETQNGLQERALFAFCGS